MTAAILDGIPLQQITEGHLNAVVVLKAPEDERLDFKSELSLARDKDKRELCKDLSALANTKGGYILFGVEEESGRANALPGIEFPHDREEQFAQVVSTGVTPRLQSMDYCKVPLANGRIVLVAKVGQDGALHQVKYDDNRYYKRIGPTTLTMEPSDIASFFQLSQGETYSEVLSDELHHFIADVKGGVFHDLKMKAGAVALFIAPSNPQSPINLVNPKVDLTLKLGPIYCSGWGHQFRGDEILTFGEVRHERFIYAVTSLNRHGVIKAANTFLLSNPSHVKLPEGVHGYVPSIAYERELISSSHRYLNLLHDLELGFPWELHLMLLGVRGYYMYASPWAMGSHGRVIDKDDIIPDPIQVSQTSQFESPQSVATLLRPVFDYIWREFNYPRSMNFGDDNIWREH